jgi:S-adenosylmethionine synthetase
MYSFTNEIVFRGHPDKMCDQIAGACLDDLLAHDRDAHAGIECAIKNNKLWIFGEVKSMYIPNYPKIARRVIKDIGYNEDFDVRVDISHQSPDIDQGVSNAEQGAGDNGVMFGYATDETDECLPVAQVALQMIARGYDSLRKEYPDIFYPDGKAEITGLYDDAGNLLEISQITFCYCNSEKDRRKSDRMVGEMVQRQLKYIERKHYLGCPSMLFNPTGKFQIGGPWADSGLTGRKIVVDAYEGFAPVGGGSMNGKDPSKVDLTGAYMARKIAKDYVLSGKHRCNVQVAYAIGKALPLSLTITADGERIDCEALKQEFKPKCMENLLGMKYLNYEEAAKYGHFR